MTNGNHQGHGLQLTEVNRNEEDGKIILQFVGCQITAIK